MGFIVRSVVNGFALWVLSLIHLLQVSITPFSPGRDLQLVLTLVALGALFGLVNSIIGTVIKIVAFPLFVLTLGLVSLLMNGILLMITAWITSGWGWGLDVGAFWPGVLAGILLSLINWVFGIILRPQKKRRR
ncbi:membrane protein [Microbacterium nanhaiense]|uniref:Membrane protein n=1 Tax=Microbacterium nanhaiense TaxID=1301026 RepID=A0ABQ2N3Y3_9MICO|nr:phage holin family protein [Microbacterium nanhaiense]GGO65383.1 membrane protein [Microbacterium nanhaiense]